MANIIIIDFSALKEAEMASKVKNLVIEHVVQHPETLITVLNSNPQSQLAETESRLRDLAFPFDAVSCNPLSPTNFTQTYLDITAFAYKTMFAVAFVEKGEHTAILVIDMDDESLEMWKNAGVKFVYNPTINSPGP